MTSSTYRIGQIVPSSNITMETEVPAMLRAREAIYPERFTFHSARMRMQKVTQEELKAMDGESLRCAVELADARVDVMGYACLVAIMSMGRGYHRQSEVKLARAAAQSGASIPIVTSAGALIDRLKALGARRIAIVTPYMRPLTELVVDYIEAEAIESLARESGVEIDPAESRRNLVTQGLSLNHLVGREFRVGTVTLRGTRLCEPCSHLETLARPGVRRGLVHRGGLRADIVNDGVIRAGDVATTKFSSDR